MRAQVLAFLLLSGCLTASKLYRWESALLEWRNRGNGNAECVASTRAASTRIRKLHADYRPQRIEDMDSDREAKKLVTDAALKCGEVVP